MTARALSVRIEVADRLAIVTLVSWSTPTTPAETPERTASVKRLRSSIWSLAERMVVNMWLAICLATSSMLPTT